MEDGNGPPAKKRKLATSATPATSAQRRPPISFMNAPVSPLSRRVPHDEAESISPPPRRRPRAEAESSSQASSTSSIRTLESKTISSPFQLTSIRDLSPASNVDTVTLKELLGDPLIKECWNFNYLHDIEFLLDAFDSDVKDLVKIKVIHGFWKTDDPNRMALEEQASVHSNVGLLSAYVPDMFGTHHSKMLVLIRHDDSAQVIIHTANMISRDWANMSQAVWRSPLLPKCQTKDSGSQIKPTGSGSRFKYDLLNYLRAYDTQRVICRPLIAELENYDFSEVRGALIASVPCQQNVQTAIRTAWGWPGLKAVLSLIPGHGKPTDYPEVIAQVSSISALNVNQINAIKGALLTIQNPSDSAEPVLKVIFPTADEIRRSLDGYHSGGSIRSKMDEGKTKAQATQLKNFRPMLHHWAGDGAVRQVTGLVMDAGRKRAAPHIKTYVRFTDSSLESIDWALVTSANLSNQAWGGACDPAGCIKIQSYEIGVLVWPELFGNDAKMVPTFKTGSPQPMEYKTLVGFRMPYDTPLVPYTDDETPWCATKLYSEPDWKGESWGM